MRSSRAHNISGVPVVDGAQLVGIVTNRDLRFEKKPGRSGAQHHDAQGEPRHGQGRRFRRRGVALLHNHRIEKVLVVNDAFELRGLITVKDIQKARDNPDACKDETRRLRVGAAVGVGGDTEERVELLVEAGVDVIVVDTAHGQARACSNACNGSSRISRNVEVIGGNIATADAAQGTRRIRRGRREGRHRPGLDLHDAHRRRRRRAADYRGRAWSPKR